MLEHKFSQDIYEEAINLKEVIIKLKEEIDIDEKGKSVKLNEYIKKLIDRILEFYPDTKNIKYLENFINRLFTRELNTVQIRIQITEFNYKTKEYDYIVFVSLETQKASNYKYDLAIMKKNNMEDVVDVDRIIGDERLGMIINIPATKMIMRMLSVTFYSI